MEYINYCKLPVSLGQWLPTFWSQPLSTFPPGPCPQKIASTFAHISWNFPFHLARQSLCCSPVPQVPMLPLCFLTASSEEQGHTHQQSLFTWSLALYWASPSTRTYLTGWEVLSYLACSDSSAGVVEGRWMQRINAVCVPSQMMEVCESSLVGAHGCILPGPRHLLRRELQGIFRAWCKWPCRASYQHSQSMSRTSKLY